MGGGKEDTPDVEEDKKLSVCAHHPQQLGVHDPSEKYLVFGWDNLSIRSNDERDIYITNLPPGPFKTIKNIEDHITFFVLYYFELIVIFCSSVNRWGEVEKYSRADARAPSCL